MKGIAAVVLAFSLSHACLAADADASPEGIAAVEELGRINGTALACAQPALVSRSRNTVTTGAPKVRHYGEAFEAATNAAFLAQGQGAECPDGAALSRRLEAAEQRLQAAFAAR
ncbi:MAG: hypothetical protein H6R10_2613 [Rhodocyclaceae bacterium]|nr:hypothetical protein [Rhodocyclaceae bacterium]